MRRLDTRLEGPILLAPDVFGDERGFFCETYRRSSFMELGIEEEMVQDNHSRSRRGVVRGMHFSVGRGATKLVRCGRGAIHDVLVDLRRGLADLRAVGGLRADRREHAHPLRAGRLRPRLLRAQRHGRRPLQAGRLLRPAADRAIKYDDPDVAIAWPLPADELIPSQRDIDAPLLRDVADELPFEYR